MSKQDDYYQWTHEKDLGGPGVDEIFTGIFGLAVIAVRFVYYLIFGDDE